MQYKKNTLIFQSIFIVLLVHVAGPGSSFADRYILITLKEKGKSQGNYRSHICCSFPMPGMFFINISFNITAIAKYFCFFFFLLYTAYLFFFFSHTRVIKGYVLENVQSAQISSSIHKTIFSKVIHCHTFIQLTCYFNSVLPLTQTEVLKPSHINANYTYILSVHL